MNNVAFTLHPFTNAAWDVLKAPCNACNDDAASQGEASALSLTLDRAPKAIP